jgi:hypothetical protein
MTAAIDIMNYAPLVADKTKERVLRQKAIEFSSL